VHGNYAVPIIRRVSSYFNIILFRGNNNNTYNIILYRYDLQYTQEVHRRYNCRVNARVCVKIRRGACALLGVCERAQGSIDRYVRARTRVHVCVCVCVCVCARGRGCRPPGLLPPPQLHHSTNVTGAKASGERTRARRMASR
jgi:hypothetical protein